MDTTEKTWRIIFYTDARGRCDVREYIDELPKARRAQVYHHLKLLRELGVMIRKPYAKPVKNHKPLWELRPGSHRLFYFAHTGRLFVILHAFRKKGWRIPKKEIAIAERRMNDFLERERHG